MDFVAAGGQHYPTAFHNNLSLNVLSGRSPGSVGRRMSNLSWILASSGLPYFQRYSTSLTQAGTGVRNRVLRIYAERPNGPSGLISDLDVANALAERMIAPPEGVARPTSSTAVISRISRSLAVIAWVLKEAAGQCEACDQPAPFKRINGTPFLEVHHLHKLADGGPDTVENAIATCPNCHRRFHHGAEPDAFVRSVQSKIPRLAQPS